MFHRREEYWRVLLVRLEFHKRSVMEFVSRTIPEAQHRGLMTPLNQKHSELKLAGRINETQILQT
jgi:hypothetical protein